MIYKSIYKFLIFNHEKYNYKCIRKTTNNFSKACQVMTNFILELIYLMSNTMKRANIANVYINNHIWLDHFGCTTHNVHIIWTIDF